MWNMKLFVIGAVFCTTFVFVLGAPNTYEQAVIKKEEDAKAYCNNLYPVAEDMRKRLATFVLKGETIPKNFNTSEWCNLYCVLEKVGYFDAEGKMQPRKIFKYTTKTLPEIAANSHTFMLFLYQNKKSTNGMEDKCEKAFVSYYRFVEAVLICTLAADLNARTDVREKVIESVLSGDELPSELETNVEKYFTSVNKIISHVFGGSSDDGSTTAAPSHILGGSSDDGPTTAAPSHILGGSSDNGPTTAAPVPSS